MANASLLKRLQYDVLQPGVSERVVFVTAAMHAYAHQWACQLVYNPRMKGGMGLSDGEGVERLWSSMRMLIPVLRVVSVRLLICVMYSPAKRHHIQRSRRPILIDRQLRRMGRHMRDGLPQYLRRRAKAAAQKAAKAKVELAKTGYERPFLEAQWEHQKAAETSVRSRASVWAWWYSF